MSSITQRLKWILSAGLAISLLSACPSEIQEDTGVDQTYEKSDAEVLAANYEPVIGKKGGRRMISSMSLPKTFNYYLAAETSSTDALGQMYLGLVKQNAVTLAYEPSLAESWEVSDDEMTYTFKIKDGLKWSDGKPITADDVVFTFNEIIDNETIPNNSRDGLLVDDKFPEVTKVDDLTVKIVTAKPFVPFMGGIGTGIMPKHIFDGTTRADASGKVTFNSMWGLNTDVKKVVVSGPWKAKEYVAGQRLILEPNPNFHEKDAEGNSLPYMDEFVTIEVQSLDTSVIKFDAGETDALSLRPEDYDLLATKQESGEFTIKNMGPSTGTLFVMFNMSTAKDEKGKPVVDPIKSKWFRNVKFRQAMAHAINKEGIIQSVYKGRATPQESHISQQSPFYNDEVPKYPFDLDKAAEKLKEAGFVKGADGMLKDADGNPVEFNLITNAGNTLRDATCAILRKDWGKLGIKVNYKTVQFNIMVQQIDQTMDWDAMMIGLTGSASEPHGGINSWKLDGRMHMFNMGGNETRWKGQLTSFEPWEKEVLELYEQGSQEFDLEKRKAIYDKAQVIVAEQLPYLFTVNDFALIAYKNSLGNIVPSIHGGSGLNQVNWNTEVQFIKE